MNLDQVERLFLTAAIARLLGWAGSVLATVGVTVNFGDDAPAKIASVVLGLAGVLAHYLISKRNLKTAVAAATDSPPTAIKP